MALPLGCHRITKPYFRTCSPCLARSQAPFCLYTRRAVSVRAEGTFGRLRYPLGGDRPSQTARLTLSRGSLLLRLESRYSKGGIPTAAPMIPEDHAPSLPPILCVEYQNPILGGRNLPDKEFRYLRTVIVTAAVHWGFSQMLWVEPGHPSLTFQHWAGVSTYTSDFSFAGTCVSG